MTFYSGVFLGLMASIIIFFGYFPGLSFLIAAALLIGLVLTFLLGVYTGRSIIVAGKSSPDLPLCDAAASTQADFRPKLHLVEPALPFQTSIGPAGAPKIRLDSIGQRTAR